MNEISKQVEELRDLQNQQTEEQNKRTEALRDEIGGKLTNLEAMMAKFLSQTPSTPDPPDLSRSAPTTNLQVTSEATRAPLLPNGLVTRLSKIEFPRFDGTMLREWIYRCEQFFMLDSTPPESKVRLASLHMEGKILQWHHTYMSTRYGQFPLWPEYIVAMTTHFGGELFDDPLAEPVSSKQNGESVEYEVQTEEKYSTEACDANLHKGGLKCDELIHRDVEPSQILVENEPNSANVPSYFTAHQVFEEMPSKEIELMDGLARDDVDLNQQTHDLEGPVIRQRILDEKLDASRLSKVIDISTNGNLLINLSSGAEKIAAESVTAEPLLKIPPMISEEEHKNLKLFEIYGFVFDPGGEVAGVLCEKSSVDCDLSCYWCLSSAEWVQAAELEPVQVQVAATSTDIICQVPLPQLIEDKIVYIYETLSTQVGDMGLCSKWAYVDPVYFVALSGILDLIITSSIFIFDPGGQCSRFTETGGSVSCLLWLCNQSYELIHHKNNILFDPWGQGSSQGGSIVTGFSV